MKQSMAHNPPFGIQSELYSRYLQQIISGILQMTTPMGAIQTDMKYCWLNW